MAGDPLKLQPAPCPSCGYCPTCGRRPYYTTNPWPWTYPGTFTLPNTGSSQTTIRNLELEDCTHG